MWIGLDFDVLPKTVRCIRINQPVHEGFDEGPLMGWDGMGWSARKIWSLPQSGSGKAGVVSWKWFQNLCSDSFLRGKESRNGGFSTSRFKQIQTPNGGMESSLIPQC